jgi:hypothetical protein
MLNIKKMWSFVRVLTLMNAKLKIKTKNDMLSLANSSWNKAI